MQRGSDEMSAMVVNGNGYSPDLSPLPETNDAKKVKLDCNGGSAVALVTAAAATGSASRVLHVRSVPPDVSETDIAQLGAPFGQVTNVMLMRNKKQAFLEMADINQAISMVNHHQHNPAQLHGKQVFVQYSAAYRELRTSDMPLQIHAMHQQHALIPASFVGQDIDFDTKTVLHVIVDNLAYLVSVDMLKQIFSRYGQVLKIVTFTKNNQFQALIQYADSISAQTAKLSLDGQNIYNGCCQLRIDFSKMNALNVRYNNEKSRDYTNPNLPHGFADGGAMQLQYTIDGVPVMSPTHATAAHHMGLGPAAASMMGHPAFPHMHGHMGHPMAAYSVAPQPPAGLPVSAFQVPMNGLSASIGGMSAMNLGFGLSQQQLAAAGLHIGLPQQTGCVVLVSNLDEEKATPDALFTLFGVYGDVHRVKILYNKKDNALIQYSDPQQAQLALTHLDKIKLWNKQIRVTPSKHPVVQMPTDQQAEGARFTKDYTNSPLHRYKKKGSKNYQNIYPPSATLHLSNIPPNVPSELLPTEFAKIGKVSGFKFFEKDHKMALVQMGSIEEAIHALMTMHNFQLGEASHLRVSFSKSTINTVNQQ